MIASPAPAILRSLPDSVGYVQHIDAAALSKIADEIERDVAIVALPGKLTSPRNPLGWVRGRADDKVKKRIVDCFSIGDVRSFDQDPRFGACVLTEIASRALSPAVNDPGTAIDVISRALRILHAWRGPVDEKSCEPVNPRWRVVFIDVADLFDDLFTPISRDGAAVVEVGLRLQKAFAVLADLGPEFRKSAIRHSKQAIDRAEAAMDLKADLIRLRAAAIGAAKTRRSG